MIQAYHFVGDTLRDGRPVPPDGEWLAHDGPLVMCESGLHASLDPFDALQYAPGPILCLVEVDGEILSTDKLVARRRRIVRRVDLTPQLRQFARECALSVIHLWDAPQVVKDYLTTGDESLRAAARDAAGWSAGWSAVWDAACDAACGATWVATCEAAWDAACDATWAASWATARDVAARATARATARDAAVWYAARDAALVDYRSKFNAMAEAALREDKP